MSRVSVIIPCYNYAHFLPDCVGSVVSQAGVEVRVLIIDDASSDHTPDTAAGLAARYPNVEFRRHPKNMGHIATYNEGFAWASGDYTVLISADDLLTPGSLLRAAQLMDAHPEVGFVFGGCVKFVTGQPSRALRLPAASKEWKITDGTAWLESVCKSGKNWITSPEVVVRTSLQHQLGGYRPELPHTADAEMWMRFAAHAAVGEILDADQAFYRLHSQNMHSLRFSTKLKDIQHRRAAYDAFFREYGSAVPRGESYHKTVIRVLASEALWEGCKAVFRGERNKSEVSDLIRYVTGSYRGNFLSLDFMRMFFSLIDRIVQSVGRKLGFGFGPI